VKIVFIGTVEFSKSALLALVKLQADIVGVATMQASSFHSDFVDLSPICEQYSIPCNYVSDINAQTSLRWIAKLRPDIIFCFGFSQLLKREILAMAPIGVIGYHPAKLPQNRGRHPIIWALARGLSRTASSFFYIDEGVDSGDIISQVDIEISYADTARTLYDKLTAAAIQQIGSFLPTLIAGCCHRIAQDSSQACYLRKRTKQDGRIDFRMSSKAIYNLVRALSEPYPGAYVVYQDREIAIWEAEEVTNSCENCEYGKIIDVLDKGIVVKCYNNAILLKRHGFAQMPKVGEYII
jgi:methionyl-tRNA formyltransferase